MKVNTRARLAAGLLVAAAALAAGPAPAWADGPCGQDYTGNTACPVNSATASDYRGTIVANNDTDYYVFYAAANTHLSLSITDTEDPTCSTGYSGGCGNVNVSLYDSQANGLGGTSYSSPSSNITVPAQWSTIIAQAGTYYLEVNGDTGTNSVGNPTSIPYDLNITATPSVVWPKPAPPPPPLPSWHSCGSWRYHPFPAVPTSSGYNLSCAQVRTDVGRVHFTHGPAWVKRGGKWGLRGGAGPGHYGARLSGFACGVSSESERGHGRTRETYAMSVSCVAAGRAFAFSWRS